MKVDPPPGYRIEINGEYYREKFKDVLKNWLLLECPPEMSLTYDMYEKREKLLNQLMKCFEETK